MNEQSSSTDITLTPFDNRRLMSLCGRFDEHIRQIEKRLGVQILNRGNAFRIAGDEDAIATASSILKQLYKETKTGKELTPSQIHLSIQQVAAMPSNPVVERKLDEPSESALNIHTPYMQVKPRTKSQQTYLQNIERHDINFGIGPAGCGKTYLAVAAGVAALEQQRARRIVLVRPVVEAGERLGFLPGDLAQKIDPYLRPLYDALHDMLGFERVNKLLEQQIIEIAPLAYMRGRTLNDAFIILDESQNTTVEQMKMFLTRIGFSAKAVITGDVTQIDLPRGKLSGLRHAMDILQAIKRISFTHFKSQDTIRHPLVKEIIEAYAKFDHPNGEQRDH